MNPRPQYFLVAGFVFLFLVLGMALWSSSEKAILIFGLSTSVTAQSLEDESSAPPKPVSRAVRAADDWIDWSPTVEDALARARDEK